MLRRFLRLLSFLLPAVVAVLSSRSASADENGSAVRVLVGFNPLPLLYGTVSGQAEVIVGGHYGFVASLHSAYETENIAPNDAESTGAASSKLTGFGGELGYHYYPWSPNDHVASFFFGPSILFGSYSFSSSVASGESYPGERPVTTTNVNESFTRLGAAMDVGLLILARPVMIQVGAGLQATFGSPPNLNVSPSMIPTMTSFTYGAGIAPRLLATVGFGF